jgi:hypothetical protein
MQVSQPQTPADLRFPVNSLRVMTAEVFIPELAKVQPEETRLS